MSFDPLEQVRRYHAALDRYRGEDVSAFFAAGAIYVSPGVGTLVGRDAIITAFDAYFAAHPDQRASDQSMARLDDRTVESAWRLAATARDTGRRIERQGREVVTFDADGLIARVDVTDR